MTKPTKDSSNKLAAPSGEWLEKWKSVLALSPVDDDVDWKRRTVLALTAIYSEVYAKARRETLEEARNLWRHFQQICIDANGCIHDFDAWLAEQLKEADGES